VSYLSRLDALIDAEWAAGREVAVKVETMSECAWWGELRFTPVPNRGDERPDRSFVLYATGGGSPEDVVERLLSELDVWRKEMGL